MNALAAADPAHARPDVPHLLDTTAVTSRPAGRHGLNPTLLRIEARRALRNRSGLIFAVIMPVAFFLMWGRNPQYADIGYGRGTVSATIMTGMALYGALIATISAGAAVSLERSTGWSRQLRLTPLSPTAYIALKGAAGMLTGALAVAAVYAVAAGTGVRLPADLWLATGLVTWLGSAVFAAFGLFLGYLFTSENAMRIVGPAMALLAFLGGLFMPLDQMADIIQTIAPYTPMYGIHQLALAPYGAGDFSWAAVANVTVWLAVFGSGAAWLMSRDTERV
ncbi:MAG: ABC transporter permease [Austwickia sp.]|nr:ABC transporter permease [Austwickia sp.]MCO5307925.1 ABC transporter permease [Austwickia sp.]